MITLELQPIGLCGHYQRMPDVFDVFPVHHNAIVAF